MAVIRNKKTNTYEVRTYYKDWTGVRKQKTKRGFKRKCDAQDWERAFKLKENRSLDMTFGDFVDIYLNDIKPRIKYNTWLTKKHIVDKKILPYFADRKLQEIKTADIRQWCWILYKGFWEQMQFMYLWLPLIFDVLIMFVLSRMNVEGANKKLKAEKGITADEVTDASDME